LASSVLKLFKIPLQTVSRTSWTEGNTTAKPVNSHTVKQGNAFISFMSGAILESSPPLFKLINTRPSLKRHKMSYNWIVLLGTHWF
jgi:hypothetical protein